MSLAERWMSGLLAGEAASLSEVAERAGSEATGLTPGELARFEGRVVGAQQWELLRRVNEVVGVSGNHPALARAILTTPLSDRGLPELPLSALLGPQPHHDSPVPPASAGVPDTELLRVAVSVLSDRAAKLPPLTAPSAPANVTGDPHQVRLSSGRVPWRRRYVLASGLPELLHSAWIERSAHPNGPTWHAWLESWRQRGGLPPQVDLAAIADRFSTLTQVYVVWSPSRTPGLEVLSAQRMGAHAAEVLRLASRSLGAIVPPASHLGHSEHLRAWLAPFTGVGLAIPQDLSGWVSVQETRQQRRLSRFAALGAPAGAVRTEEAEPLELPATAGALQIATRVLAAGID